MLAMAEANMVNAGGHVLPLVLITRHLTQPQKSIPYEALWLREDGRIHHRLGGCDSDHIALPDKDSVRKSDVVLRDPSHDC